jgi:hypothetical protein
VYPFADAVLSSPSSITSQAFYLPDPPPQVPKAVIVESAPESSAMAGTKRSADSLSDDDQQSTKRQKLDHVEQQADSGVAIDISDDEIEIL